MRESALVLFVAYTVAVFLATVYAIRRSLSNDTRKAVGT